MLEEVLERTWVLVNHGNWKLLSPTSVLGMHILSIIHTVGFVSRMQPWESNVLLRPSGWCMWLIPAQASILTFKILTDGCRDRLFLWSLFALHVQSNLEFKNLTCLNSRLISTNTIPQHNDQHSVEGWTRGLRMQDNKDNDEKLKFIPPPVLFFQSFQLKIKQMNIF